MKTFTWSKQHHQCVCASLTNEHLERFSKITASTTPCTRWEWRWRKAGSGTLWAYYGCGQHCRSFPSSWKHKHGIPSRLLDALSIRSSYPNLWMNRNALCPALLRRRQSFSHSTVLLGYGRRNQRREYGVVAMPRRRFSPSSSRTGNSPGRQRF